MGADYHMREKHCKICWAPCCGNFEGWTAIVVPIAVHVFTGNHPASREVASLMLHFVFMCKSNKKVSGQNMRVMYAQELIIHRISRPVEAGFSMEKRSRFDSDASRELVEKKSGTETQWPRTYRDLATILDGSSRNEQLLSRPSRSRETAR